MLDQNFKFDCVFCYVSDLDRSIDFYSQILGFHFMSRDAVVRFNIDGVLFELVPACDDLLLSGGGNARRTFAVDNINKAKENLLSKQVVVSKVLRVLNGFLATFTDSDGNEIVLWQYAE